MGKAKTDTPDPYFRTIEMFQKLEPSWAKAENATLAAVVARMDTLRLPEMTVKLELAHIATAAAGHEVGAHLHAQAELFRVESGRVTFLVSGKKVVYRRGDIGILPSRTIHSWVNGSRNAVFLGTMFMAEPACGDRNSLGYRLAIVAEALGYRIKPDGEISRALDALWKEIQTPRIDSVNAGIAHLTTAFILSFRQLREALKHPIADEAEVLTLNERYVLAAQAYIRTHLSEQIRIQDVADVVGISGRHLNRMFQNAGLGCVGQCIEQARVEHAQWLLGRGNYSVKTVARLCGFNDAPYFSRVFKNVTGRLPSAVRKVADGI